MEIKRVVDKIFDFNPKNTSLIPDNEILNIGADDEFRKAMMKSAVNKEVIMVPTGYKKGLYYDYMNGEIVNIHNWHPAIIKFTLDFNGLKKNTYYKITVSARNPKKHSRLIDVTDDRTLYVVTNNNDLIINSDLSDVDKPECFSGIFKSYENSISINLKFGKIAINNISIEEVEMFEDDSDENIDDVIIDHNRLVVVSASAFSMVSDSKFGIGDMISLKRIYGKGLTLHFNKKDKCYLVERDNIDDVIGVNLNSNYINIDINSNKAIGECVGMKTVKCSSDLSPNTLKSGYLVFGFVDKKGNLVQLDEGVVSIVVNKII